MGLNMSYPRHLQNCGNCTAFVPLGRHLVKMPSGVHRSVDIGKCCREPHGFMPVPQQVPGSSLEVAGPRQQIGTAALYRPATSDDWCRDGWELDKRKQEGKRHGVVAPSTSGALERAAAPANN